jgi:hypothetical protein
MKYSKYKTTTLETNTMKNIEEKGYIFVPYIPITTKTTINDETVWYKNKFKNLLLKIKHFFIKPKCLKCFEKYKNRPVNQAYYSVIKIDKL